MFLLDTDICIYFLKGKYAIDKQLEQVGYDHCFISEITLAELKYGAEKSDFPKQNHFIIDSFISGINVLPIINAIPLYAKEKARLIKSGNKIDDFDLFIGTTSVAHGLTLVTHNKKHFSRIADIQLADWAK